MKRYNRQTIEYNSVKTINGRALGHLVSGLLAAISLILPLAKYEYLLFYSKDLYSNFGQIMFVIAAGINLIGMVRAYSNRNTLGWGSLAGLIMGFLFLSGNYSISKLNNNYNEAVEYSIGYYFILISFLFALIAPFIKYGVEEDFTELKMGESHKLKNVSDFVYKPKS
ncbi:MAG: hypothetical protein INQ03_24315 [Candidatus Heimdallarchaeota archaeon]|nr:hypothetical protein [Candidatus Heimdallarchaeota archaeon]